MVPSQPHLMTPDTALLGCAREGYRDNAIAYIVRRKPIGYTAYDVGIIVDHYFLVGQACGIDPILAIAQMVHETGALTSWWSQRPRRNPAGIGVTGRTSSSGARPAPDWIWNAQRKAWVQGHTFTTWNDAALAHYGHLLAYMYTNKQLGAEPLLAGIVEKDPRAHAIPVKNRGAVKTLRDLNGRWAVPGTTYADRIAATANAIIGL